MQSHVLGKSQGFGMITTETRANEASFAAGGGGAGGYQHPDTVPALCRGPYGLTRVFIVLWARRSPNPRRLNLAPNR